MKTAATILWAAAAMAAVGADNLFKGGLWKEFVYDKPTDAPIIFGGASRCKDACAQDYCIYLDIWLDDGTPVWGRRAEWAQGTHGWETTAGAYAPPRPVKKIQMYAFLRKGKGKASFKDLWLERREGRGDVLASTRRTGRPYTDGDVLEMDVFTGRRIETKRVPVPGPQIPSGNPLAADETAVWTADSMRMVTPLTFPSAAERAAAPAARVSLARRERESFQVLVSTGEGTEWEDGSVVLPVLRNARGEALKGSLDWRRVGYLARQSGYFPHPCGVPETETWLPDPLLPPAPFRVRRGATQGLWFTVHAAPDAAPGTYAGDVILTSRGGRRATVRVTAVVEDFALPETFGMPTAFAVMDGFTRAQYPDRFAEKKRESWDIMLDHRLNPDDISRTTPPDIDDLLHARARGMNHFNILNIVPPPKDARDRWVCHTPPEATENPAFYPAFKARLDPYVAQLRRHGLEKLAYLYGFDERGKEYYQGIDVLWKKLKADFPDIPVMTTAMMYRDYAAGKTNLPCLVTTDWYCPLTDVYRTDVSEKMRALGKQVWWYVCCAPTYPCANFASMEYPPVEGRLLGWMTHLYRADGLLFWHVNYWNGPCLDESDTFLPAWKTANDLHMPGDGILLYPGKEHILPSIRLAQVRDGVEDYEWLQLAAAKAGAAKADAESRTLIRTLTDFTRDPAAVRAARARLARLIAPAAAPRGARLAPVDDAETAVCRAGETVFNDRDFQMTDAAAARLEGLTFLRRTIEGGFTVKVVADGDLVVVTPIAGSTGLSQGARLAAMGFAKDAGAPFQAFGKNGCDRADIWRKRVRAGETLALGKWALVCGFDPAGQNAPDPAVARKEARILAHLDGTPSATEAPRDILVNKPDYVVFVPKQPRDRDARDPARPGDTYNDHFQVIDNPKNGHLYAFWTQASKEGDVDQHIAFSKSTDKGETWTAPVVLAGSANRKNPSLRASWQQPMLTKSGRLYCLWNQQTTSRGPHCGMMFGAYSDDDGDTWTSPKRVPFTQRMDADPADPSIPPSWCNWQRPLRLGENGKFFVGCSRHGKAPYDARGGCKIEFWQFENMDDNPEPYDIRLSYFATNRNAFDATKIAGGTFMPKEGPAVEEAGLVKLPDGRLFALMRSSIGHPVWSQSRDGGRTWTPPRPLLDRDGGTPFLHPRSPCPIYDWKGPEAASGTYFALVHQTFDFNGTSAYQTRGPLYLLAGRFVPDADQPVWFDKPPQLFAPRPTGNSFYTSYCLVDGKGVLWYNDKKFYLCGRIIGPEWFR